jgi:hypothetical protein
MRMQTTWFTLFRAGCRICSLRNLACLTIVSFGIVSVGVSQQPVQDASAQSTAVQPTAAPISAKPLNEQSPRQKQLADDTAKLLTLANELKVEINKSSKDTLSLSVIKKAEQVEKLAHKVRDEMRDSLVN